MNTYAFGFINMRGKLVRPVFILLRIIDLCLQYACRVNDRRICYISTPEYSDSPYYLFRHVLRTRCNYDHVWLVDDVGIAARILNDIEKVAAKAGTTGHTLKVAKRRSLYGYFLYLTSKNVFHTHGIYSFPRSSVKRNIVSLWHGMPIKRVGALIKIPDPFSPFGTLHIATSEFFKFIVAASFRASPDNVLICLLPRCDPLISESAMSCSRESIRSKLGLEPQDKMLLWMPTFRVETPTSPTFSPKSAARSFMDDFDADFLAVLSAYAQKRKVTIVIKLHPGDCVGRGAVLGVAPNIVALTNDMLKHQQIELYDLIACSDALWSDVSSVLIDYLVSERPIGIVGFNPKKYGRGTNFPVEYLFKEKAFQQLSTLESCKSFLDMICSNESLTAAKTQQSGFFVEEVKESGSDKLLSQLGI